MQFRLRFQNWIFKTLNMKKIVLIALSALAMVSCAASYDSARMMQGGLKLTQALTISNADIQSSVTASVAQLDAQNTVLTSGAYVTRLAKITKGLTEVDGIPLKFKVYKTNEVNAFACADGNVRVYTGLMDIMTDEEVLSVIGHEVGHVALQHSLNAYKHALMTSAARDAIAAQGTVANLADSILGELGESMVQAKYSRKQETAADDFGYEFMKGAGRNPWHMALAFEKLQSASGSDATAAQVAQMFSSHPDTASRIERVSKKATKDGYTRP